MMKLDDIANDKTSAPSARPAGERRVVTVRDVDVAFRWIPPGRFLMGDDDVNWNGSKKTVHDVKISQGFWLAETETTQKLWKAVMGNNPSEFKGNDLLPVETVSWLDCDDFVMKLNGLGVPVEGQFRLPTEAEWEYACRVGATDDYNVAETTLGDLGWHSDNSDGKTHPVGKKTPNAWGLFDMHGNVWEWCSDWYDEYYYSSSPTIGSTGPLGGRHRVLRGGSWDVDAKDCRAARRLCIGPGNRDRDCGFRLVLTDSK